jgi:hypothetical protein
MVTLPVDFRTAEGPPDEQRLEQLAQALCGCWVISLPETGVMRLLEAIMGGENSESEGDGRVAAGAC